MDFRYFPLDHQRCGLSIESFSLPQEDLVYIWSKDGALPTNDTIANLTSREASLLKSEAVAFHPNASTLPHLIIIGYSAVDTFMLRHDGQNHSRLILNFYFARSLGFYLIQVYLPATLMVVTSWISFWISRHSAPARITLSVTTVLTVVTLTLQDYHSSLPKLSYLKALDLFHMTCFIFVFLVLVEFAIVSYASKQFYHRSGRYSIESDDARPSIASLVTRSAKTASLATSSKLMRRGPETTHKTRRMSKMMFTSEGEAIITTTVLSTGAREGFQNAVIEMSETGSNFRKSSKVSFSDLEQRYSFQSDTLKKLAHLPSRIEVVSRWLFPLSFLIFNIAYWKKYYFNHHDDIENDHGFVEL